MKSAVGVEPLPLKADYHDIVARMEVWLFGPAEAPDGVLALHAEPDALLIWSVATAPGAQGSGLGGAMLDFAHARARALQLPTSYTEDDLDVRISTDSDRAVRRARGQRSAHGQGDGDSGVRAQVRVALFGVSHRVAGIE